MAEPRDFRLLLVGYGTVNRNVHELIEARAAELSKLHGVRPIVVGIARRGGVVRGAGKGGIAPQDVPPKPRDRGGLKELLADTPADCVVEATPTDLKTGEPGLGHIRAALAQRKHVVTANKGPLALALPDLTALARESRVALRYEATVAGAIPVLNTAERSLLGYGITGVDGILNGTSNFILTRMADEGTDFSQALKEARELGYAEADPSNDVDGHDAAAKAVILANAVLGLPVRLKDVHTTGITSLTREAMELAKERGMTIKLIASVARDASPTVAPRLLPRGSMLDVGGTLNVVRFRTERAGPIALVGHGAGGPETASAVLSDILAVAMSHHVSSSG